MLLALACLALSPQQTPEAANQLIPPPQTERPGLGQPVAGLHPQWRLEPIDLGAKNLRILEFAGLKDGRILFSAADLDVETEVWDPQLYQWTLESGDLRSLTLHSGFPSGLCTVDDSVWILGLHTLDQWGGTDGADPWTRRTSFAHDWADGSGVPLFRGLHSFGGRLVTLFSDPKAAEGGSTWHFSGHEFMNSVMSIDPTNGLGGVEMAGFHYPVGCGLVHLDQFVVIDRLGSEAGTSALYEFQPGRFAGFPLSESKDIDGKDQNNLDFNPTIYGDRAKQAPALYFPGELGSQPRFVLWSGNSKHHSDILIGDVTEGSIHRIELEQIGGALQGALFRHSHGLPKHAKGMTMAPNGSLLLATLEPSNRRIDRSRLHVMRVDDQGYQPFEIQSVKVRPNGFSIEFTKGLAPEWMEDPSMVRIQSWRYSRLGEKLDLREHPLTISDLGFGDSAEVILVKVQDFEAGRVYHIQCDAKSRWSKELWSGEAWYTVNRIPGAVDLPNIGLGALPPADATPLIGTSASTLMDYQGRAGDLPVYEQEDFVNGPGYLEVGHGSGNLVSRTTHGDAHVHVEWYCPPGGEGDTRSNSGVYLHGRYEVQVFGTPADAEPRAGGAGAIYGQHAPSRNMSTGPGTWQAYDIFFSAPRFEDGEKTRDARISMFWNGVRVHGEAVVSSPTGGAQGEEAPTGQLLLQDYRDGAEDPVRFRNVWIRDWNAPKWQPGEWQTPFDDPSNWMVRGGKAHFELKDSLLRGTTRPNTPNSFYTSRQKFEDFELLFEARVHPELNSGVQIRSELVGDPEERNAPLRGYQVEIDPSPRSWTAGLYEERGRGWLHPLNTQPYAREAFHPGQWNQFRVLAEGPRIRTWLNGIPVADVYDAERTTGHLGFQVHGVGERTDPLEVAWRHVRIRELRNHTK